LYATGIQNQARSMQRVVVVLIAVMLLVVRHLK
jgi:hypothetical protein